ncbi:lysophospholipase, partial [Mesorhizobium sp. M8A.F.Ca.ET.173.01.1.1]
MDGMTAKSTFDNFLRLIDVARKQLGPIPIFCLSVKQSLANWIYADEVMRLNALIADFCSGDPHTTYVDVATCLLGENGRPMGRYFK